jgi:hypothetical protein
VFYGSNRYRKDNPRSATGYTPETQQTTETTYDSRLPCRGHIGARADRVRNGCGNSIAWLIGRQRRAGILLYAGSDAEARWWHWHVAEYRGGLGRQYRDARFAAPRQGDRLDLLSPRGPG